MGSSIYFICPYLLEGSANVEEIRIAAVTPPTVYEFYFTTKYYSNINLYVPDESVADYEMASPWNKCNIIGGGSNVNSISIDTESSSDDIYTINGVRVTDTTNLPKGIYIKNGKKIIR